MSEGEELGEIVYLWRFSLVSSLYSPAVPSAHVTQQRTGIA